MDKRDYIAQVDDLRCPQALRERIGALPGQVRRPRRHWLPLCACAAVVLIGAGGFLLLQNGGLGGSSAGGGHEEGSSVFLSYAGPVFPLTVLDGAELSAGREITLDFSLWDRTWISNQEEAASRTELTEAGRRQVLDDYNEWFPDGGRYESSTDLLVHDAYVLTNSTQQAQTVTLLYPFVGQLQHLSAQTPTLTVDGVPAEATLRSGGYSGGFQGALGADLITAETAGSLNLDQLDSWEDYKALLSAAYRSRSIALPTPGARRRTRTFPIPPSGRPLRWTTNRPRCSPTASTPAGSTGKTASWGRAFPSGSPERPGTARPVTSSSWARISAA